MCEIELSVCVKYVLVDIIALQFLLYYLYNSDNLCDIAYWKKIENPAKYTCYFECFTLLHQVLF